MTGKISPLDGIALLMAVKPASANETEGREIIHDSPARLLSKSRLLTIMAAIVADPCAGIAIVVLFLSQGECHFAVTRVL